MTDRHYYSERQGRKPTSPGLSLADVKRALKVYFDQLETEGHFQEDLGYNCIDKDFVPGSLGSDPQTEILLTLNKPNLWPIHSTIDEWTEDDLFDMLEFLHAHTSKPTERYYHSYYSCGWHCTDFDRKSGQQEFRTKVNRILVAYDSGFELSAKGEVQAKPPTGLEPLLAAPLPQVDATNVSARVDAALRKFRHHRASPEERRDAVRDLADVFEFLRPKLKTLLLSQDEADLFNIANNFGIRHHRPGQKVDYDKAIWLDWIFYHYLATIHTVCRLLERQP